MSSLELREQKCDHGIELSASPIVVSNDYEKLRNKPKLNGQEIVGDVEEVDPTVPSWAKKPSKPEYNYDEVKAVGAENVLTIPQLAEMLKLFDPT